MRSPLIATLALSHVLVADNPDPNAVMTAIVQVRADANAGKLDPSLIPSEQARIASDALAKVDMASVTADEAVRWVQVCQFANDTAKGADFAQKALGQRSWELLNLETAVMVEMLKAGQVDQATVKARWMGFGLGPAMLGQFHVGLRPVLAEVGKSDPDGVVKFYDVLVGRLDMDDPISAEDKRWGPVVYAELNAAKFAVLYNAGREEEAMKGLEALKAEVEALGQAADAHGTTAVDYVTKTIDRLTGQDTLSKLSGSQAPALVYDRLLGDFAGADSLKGKVVLLDFMAHWCGPCIRAFPDLVKLYQEESANGLEIVSLTGYYGYFGTEQGIEPEVEYESMKGFVDKHKLTWPVLFDGTQTNMKNYGVTGIPQLVVIDRSGIVRKIEIGYTPESFAETADLVKKLLAE